jgi:hypothetical protein
MKITVVIYAVIISAVPLYLNAQTDREHLANLRKPDRIDLAIDKGLAWLVTKQDVTEGYFQGKFKNTETALACIALMAAGHFPGRSGYGQNLEKGILYLVKACRNTRHYGYFGYEGSSMYGHGICPLALAEAYGMMGNPADNRRVKEALNTAVQVILKAQIRKQGRHFGGWRYSPTGNDADLSVTAWQILSLRSAQNCGLKIPETAVADALNYIRRCYNSKSGGYAYMPGNGPSNAMRCAGIVSLLALGAGKNEKDLKNIRNSAKILKTLKIGNESNFYYSSYYFSTAANMLGKKYRDYFLPKMEKVLLALQMDSGEFKKNKGHLPGVYATSFAVICLAVKYQFLPIYQE